jgi:hypothetical protein
VEQIEHIMEMDDDEMKILREVRYFARAGFFLFCMPT